MGISLLGRLLRWARDQDQRTSRLGSSNGSRMKSVEPIRIRDLAHEVPGKWVALRDHEIVEVADTLDALMAALANRCISDVTVMRAAAENEIELVGLG